MEMKGITKRFPGVVALDNVTFEAYPGEILALCGENGAGKSTLMKVLSGVYGEGSYDGEIIVDRQLCHFTDPAKSVRAGIAMIYQEISMHLDMSIAENIFIGSWPMHKGRVDWKRMNTDAAALLKRVGLDMAPNTILRRLSASQQQLVSIARALSKDPRILVLDEPTSPLTKLESDLLFEILFSLKAQGIACILITHKMEEVFKYSDRVTVLRDGKTISTYRREEATEERIISDMVGRSFSSYYPKEQVKIGDVALEIRHFSVAHPFAVGKKIIDDVSLKVHHGEILGIAGLVGAGRSELLNAVFGKDPKLSGEVLIEGNPVVIRNPEDAMRCGIGLVTEDRKKDGIIGNMTIRENLTLPNLDAISSHGILRLKKEREFAGKYYAEMGVKAPNMEAWLCNLSGGNQQKVVLGKWVARAPRVLILDEPTRGVDVGAKYEIYKIMVELAKKGLAIIMISSELPELLSMSDRIIIIAAGQVMGEMPAAECSQERIMALATKN